MAKEKEAYRDNIALLREMFPGRVQLGKVEAAQLLHVDTRAINKYVKTNEFGKVSISDLARAISG